MTDRNKQSSNSAAGVCAALLLGTLASNSAHCAEPERTRVSQVPFAPVSTAIQPESSQKELIKPGSISAAGVQAKANLAAAPETDNSAENTNDPPSPGAQPASSQANHSEADQQTGASYQACSQAILTALDGVTLYYEAVYKSIGVDSQRSLKQLSPGRWALQSHAEWLFFSIDEQSEFQLPDWQLLRFDHNRKGMGDRHNLTVTVTPQSQHFSATARGTTKTYSYQAPLFDELNHQLKLQLDVACIPEQQEFHYRVAKRKGLREYTYTRQGKESVATDAGEFSAVRLEKFSKGRKTTIWLAPELAYSVVKLLHEDDGETASLSIKARPKLPATGNQ